ncbi:MAG: DUF4358 domain-containing protein [Sarcina sp.]
MKKFLILFIFSFSLLLISCTKNQSINLSTLDIELHNDIIMDNFKSGSVKDLRRFFGISNSDFKEFLFFKPAYTMDVNEILILKLNDESDRTAIKDKIDERVQKQIETFGSYGPSQCAILEDYIIKEKGDYLFYCVSTDSEKIYEIFKEGFE